MADVVYRGNLKASSFPFLSELSGRSIIVKQTDQTAPLGDFAKATTDASGQGIPQIFYCHNVLPTDNGYMSVSYDQAVAPPNLPAAGWDDVSQLRDSNGNKASLVADAAGNLHILPSGSATWIAPTGAPFAGTISGKRITTAFVGGVTYIYFSNVGCYTYNFATNTMAPQVLSGLVAADILGLVAVRGYLVAYSVSAVFWSSTLTAVDFVPDLATGAGGGQLEGARGQIVTIEAVFGGMIAFTTGNAIAATSSDNVRFPFNFLEITGCGGLTNAFNVALDSNSSSLYAYTTAGLQQIALKQAVVVFPEATDFLSGNVFEDFDELTQLFTRTEYPEGTLIVKKLVLISSRYLVISYGIGGLHYAIVYDVTYKQWGKLKIDHADCFEINLGAVEVPKNSIAFLTAGGGIYTVSMGINNPTANGVMIVGKFQYVRSRLLTLDRVAFENVSQNAAFNLYDLPTQDGKNFTTPLIGYLAQSAGQFREYLFHNTALNHSILCIGGFNAVSIVLTFHINGAR